jgi:hypothetical protein
MYAPAHAPTHPSSLQAALTHLGPCVPAVSANSYFNDISRFDPTTNAWATLSTSGLTPSGRWWMGFSAAPDGTIFLFGGGNGNGGNGG